MDSFKFLVFLAVVFGAAFVMIQRNGGFSRGKGCGSNGDGHGGSFDIGGDFGSDGGDGGGD